jgi:hypothetical protein
MSWVVADGTRVQIPAEADDAPARVAANVSTTTARWRPVRHLLRRQCSDSPGGVPFRPRCYSGMLPCLRFGPGSRFVSSVWSALTSLGRVSCGRITSSM